MLQVKSLHLARMLYLHKMRHRIVEKIANMLGNESSKLAKRIQQVKTSDNEPTSPVIETRRTWPQSIQSQLTNPLVIICLHDVDPLKLDLRKYGTFWYILYIKTPQIKYMHRRVCLCVHMHAHTVAILHKGKLSIWLHPNHGYSAQAMRCENKPGSYFIVSSFGPTQRLLSLRVLWQESKKRIRQSRPSKPHQQIHPGMSQLVAINWQTPNAGTSWRIWGANTE